MQQELARLRDRIHDAHRRGTPLVIRGGGTRSFCVRESPGATLDTRGYTGIVSYEPTELVITARCGTPLHEIESALEEKGQYLPFEPPRFDPLASTIGGVIAAGHSGPRRAAVGAARDFVLGTVMIDARAQVLSLGGEVMKNVAGYDVSRLLCGSHGTLGLIAEVSLKVLPRPVHECTLELGQDEAAAIAHINRLGREPLPISASWWRDGISRIRLSGARAGLDAAVRIIGGRLLDEAQSTRFWGDVRDQRETFFASEGPLWRLSLPSNVPPLGLPGATAIEWGGALRWFRPRQPLDAQEIRSRVSRAGGTASLFRRGNGHARDASADPNGAPNADPLHPLDAGVRRIHERLRQQLDPKHVFNRGRLYEGL